MALQYVVTKRVFGFDKTNTEKYVAKSVGSGKMNFDKMCEKVSRLCGIHRKVVDLVVSGLVDMMAEDIDDGKTIQMGEFGLFRPTIKTKSAEDVLRILAVCERYSRFATLSEVVAILIKLRARMR